MRICPVLRETFIRVCCIGLILPEAGLPLRHSSGLTPDSSNQFVNACPVSFQSESSLQSDYENICKRCVGTYILAQLKPWWCSAFCTAGF